MKKEQNSSFRLYGHLLVRYLRPQGRRVTLLGFLILGSISLQLVNPQLVRRFLDAAETGRSLDELVSTAVLFMSIAIIAQGFKLVSAYVSENVAWTATNDLRADLALHCLRLDLSFHKTHKPGELIERVDGDVNQLANFFSQLIIQLGSNLLLMTGVMALLWLVDWRVGTTITALAVVGMLALNYFKEFTVPRWQALRQIESELFGYLEEWLNGTEAIQTNGAALYVMRRLYQMLRRRWQAMQRAMRMNMFVMGIPIVVPTLAYVAAYIWGDRLFNAGTLTIGTVFLIIYYIDILKEPLWVIQRRVQDLQKASASLNRIMALFAEESTIHNGEGVLLPNGPLAVQFDGVSFHYEDDEADVLTDVDFMIEPRHVLGLLGRTGSGKTTISRLLFHFYDPTKGSIRLGNENLVDLRDTTQIEIRRRIGMVTQDVELFHASVRDNLTLFDDTIDDDGILAALGELGLSGWLAGLSNGLDTRLEGNSSLSAGEAQLLALGRVFLADPGLVILDEASSRLDPATEMLIELAINMLLDGRTGIIIAHRLSTVQRADKIMILDGGRILEYGKRTILAANPESQFFNLLQTGLVEAIV